MASEGRSFDGEPCPKAKIDDGRIKSLCSKMYRIARQNCDTEVERRKVKRVTPEQLEAWGVISKIRGKWVGSNAYALLVGDPSFSIRLKCGLFKGDDKAVFLDRREFTGSISELIDAGLDYVLAKINKGCYFKGAYRHDRYELPPDEMRELVINAFAHRSYLEHDAPVFLAIYDTRVEITSPGGLPRGQTAERAVAGYSKIRNEVLAKALNYMRFIEEWGSGLKRVNDVLGEYGIRNVSVEDAGFAVRMNVYRAAAGNNNDSGALKQGTGALNGALKQGSGALNGALRPGAGAFEEKVLTVISSRPGINRKGIIEQVGVAPRSLDRLIAAMIESGKIKRLGGKKAGGYYCKE